MPAIVHASFHLPVKKCFHFISALHISAVEQVLITSSPSLEAVFLEYILIFTRINQGAKGVGNAKRTNYLSGRHNISIVEKKLSKISTGNWK